MATDYGDVQLGDTLTDVDVQATISGPTSPLTLFLGGNIVAKRINAITGALTINLDTSGVTGGPQLGDELVLVVVGAATPGTIIWGTGILVQSGQTTLALVASKKKLCKFTWDGDAYFLHTVAIQP